MLIEFSVENYRSIRDRVVLDMVAKKLRSAHTYLDQDNVVECTPKLTLLRSVCMYGANASGKSNLIRAFSYMRRFVVSKGGSPTAESTGVEPFLLDTVSQDKATTFEVVFLIDGLQYRYGFDVTTTSVLREWLYFTPTIREVPLFTRDEHGIQINKHFSEGNRLRALTRRDALFLSVVAQFNGQIAAKVVDWFGRRSAVLVALDDKSFMPYTERCIEQQKFGDHLENIVQSLDLGISGLSVLTGYEHHDSIEREETSVPDARTHDLEAVVVVTPRSVKLKGLITRHLTRQPDGRVVSDVYFDARAMESQGTLKAIALLGPLLDVLSFGKLLFIDEIDARLHPLITKALIDMFNSPRTNPHGAQLVCVTHDTNLLDRKRLRRDQIYFTEKDNCERTHLYSLSEFKISKPEGQRSVRNDASLEQSYIEGRFGAIPYLGDIGSLFVEEFQRETTDGRIESELSEVD